VTCLQSVFTHKSTYPIGVKKQILSVKITTRTSCGEKASEGAYSERVLHRGSYAGRLMGLLAGGGVPIGAQPLSSVLANRAVSCSFSCGAPRLAS